MKILLIVNPKAGRHSIINSLDKIESNFKKDGNLDISIIHTKIDYNAKDIIANYDLSKLDLVIFCGGDGTLNEGINGLIENKQKIPISFIPRGTMNDFAKSIKMPTGKYTLSKIIKSEENLEIEEFDIGKINDRHFCYVAAFGNFTDVGYVTSQKLKNSIGRFAYYLTVLKEIFHIKSYEIEADIDGYTFKDNMIIGFISNSVSVAGLKMYKRKNVDLKDGTLDVLLIKKPKNILGYFKIIKGFIKKEYTLENNYYYRKGKNIKIKSKENIAWTVDGEYFASINNVEIINLNKYVKFAIPKKNN